MFSEDRNRVVLVKKNKPKWQAGKLNGAGGKIEAEESPHQAMVREFDEETGVLIGSWTRYAIMRGPDWEVHVYFSKGNIDRVRTIEEEEVMIANVSDLLNLGCIENLPWLIHLALDVMEDGRPEHTEIVYPL